MSASCHHFRLLPSLLPGLGFPILTINPCKNIYFPHSRHYRFGDGQQRSAEVPPLCRRSVEEKGFFVYLYKKCNDNAGLHVFKGKRFRVKLQKENHLCQVSSWEGVG
ncbi:uncharacterized protein [Henckelia pumila]|uniref:uncharacterized protein n=1 Tax=Henckelia pumila TaxID=405737 RepID=UPI003C6E2269